MSFVTLVLAIATALSASSDISRAETVACPRVAFAPVLDGRLDDWPPLPQIVVADASDWQAASPQYAEYGGPRDISAEVRLAWDGQALYLAIETTDDNIVRVRSAAEIDRGDSVVLAFKGEDSDQTNQFVVALLATRTSLVWRAEPAQSAGEVRTVGRGISVRDDDGVKKIVYELAIPWAELKQIRPLPGTAFALTVSACDDDGAGLKGCLEHTSTVRLSTAGIAPTEAAEGSGRTSGLTPSFPAPDAVRFDEKGFVVSRNDVLLFGGEIEYWLLPEAAWHQRINLLQAEGMNLVGVTVPWSRYQPLRHPADLGELRRFLDLCKSSGLSVQVSVGPFAGERLPAGGVPGWVLELPSGQDKEQALREWLQTLMPLIGEYQASKGGPIVCVVERPLPDAGGMPSAGGLEQLFSAIRASGITIPVLTANAPAARASAPQVMVNLLDTLSFYEPVGAEALAALVQALSREEIGPALITALPGDYRQLVQARRSADLVKIAFAKGAAGVTLSDFAPGFDAAVVTPPGSDIRGIVDPAGALAPGYVEMRLLGTFLHRFGSALARGTPAEGVVETDDPAVRAAVRYGKERSFLFLWDEKGRGAHQVRLSYLAPDREARVSIPEAGTINLTPGGAKILLLETPFGRGTIRYCTSEVLGLHQVGDRWLLTVYGDVDTPGEIAITLPGPPLVSGDVARQNWNAEDKTLTLDYYHGEKDRYILADELEIAVLSRDRAATTGLATSGGQGVTLVAGANVEEISLDSQSIEAAVDCRPGVAEVTAALPQSPMRVLVDGNPVPFTFKSPERVVAFQITTPSLGEERRPANVLDRLGRAIAGGPPHLYARFDRALFMPDAEAPAGACSTHDRIAVAPEELGLAPGSFVRLRTHFTAEGAAELAITGSAYPLVVSVNGKLADALSTYTPDRRADISSFVRPGSNDLEIVAYVLPRSLGAKGIREPYARLPEVKLGSPAGEIALSEWEVCAWLRGEAAGYPGSDVDERRWHFITLGAWREQGRELADVWGVGWYRMTFKLPMPDGWSIPYYLDLDLRGAGKVYFDGRPIAAPQGDGSYHLPVPSSVTGRDNVLALAVYGVGADTGLYSAQVAADESRMTRRRNVEIRF
jgi:hypothetical protein